MWVTSPQVRQAVSGRGVLPGCEHGPHQLVASRIRPGLPHRGQGCQAAARRSRTRHMPQISRPARPILAPHRTQVREHSTHLPVASSSFLAFPQPGHSRRTGWCARA